MNINNRMSDVSQALIVYVTEHPGCTFQTLQGVFCPNAATGKGSVTEQFRARVAYLVSMGHLACNTVDGQRLYTRGNGVREVKPLPAKPVHVVVEPTLQRTPAPQHNRFTGQYVPEVAPCLRPGALDYKRVASIGDRC